LGAALSRLAEREGARGGVDEEEGEEDVDVDAIGEDLDNGPATSRKRAAGSKDASVAGDDDEFVDDEDDGAYEEPKTKRAKKSRKR
jgi:DNA excision repair protein ERCC-5